MIVDPFAETIWDIDNQSDEKSYCLYESQSDCKGHHPYDLTFSTVVTRTESGSYTNEYITNMQLRTALTPTSYAVPYIYNNFKWEHCNDLDLGVTFPDV